MQANLLPAFTAALEKAGGRLVRLADAEAIREWCAAEYPGEEFGLDSADLLVAETGTVVRSYPDREASRVSLVPAVSVFTADPADLVPDLPAALDRLAGAHRAGPAYTVLITGPSRTADIEKTLVIPAHGPRALIVAIPPEEER